MGVLKGRVATHKRNALCFHANWTPRAANISKMLQIIQEIRFSGTTTNLSIVESGVKASNFLDFGQVFWMLKRRYLTGLRTISTVGCWVTRFADSRRSNRPISIT